MTADSGVVSIPDWIVTFVGRQALENEGLRREVQRLAAERDDLLAEKQPKRTCGEVHPEHDVYHPDGH